MSKTLSPQEAARRDRLSAALRENLKRRKAQAKERAKAQTSAHGEETSDPGAAQSHQGDPDRAEPR